MRKVTKNIRFLFPAICVSMIVGAVGLPGTPAVAQEGDLFSDKSVDNKMLTVPTLVGIVDLRNGRVQIKSPQISVWNAPADTDGDGFYETVLKVDLAPGGFRNLCVLLDYNGPPSGFTLNIGDSATNNGGGGDQATQSRDAEMQILDDEISVFASDMGGIGFASRIARSTTGLQDCGFKVCVSNMYLAYGNSHSEIDFTTTPHGADLLYALNGQPDTEGPVNYDIFLGFNRVVYGAEWNDRIGSGLAQVYLMLE